MEKELRQLLAEYKTALANLKPLHAERNKRIAKLLNQGMTYAEVGKKMGISRQRVHQIHMRMNRGQL